MVPRNESVLLALRSGVQLLPMACKSSLHLKGDRNRLEMLLYFSPNRVLPVWSVRNCTETVFCFCGKNQIGFAEGFGLCRNARYFPIQKRLKITPSRSSAVNSPVISPSACWARRSSSANSSSAGRMPSTTWRAAETCSCAVARARR